ncbi:methylenetetrahydrofolate reductase [Spirochaetia bacterium]|nr:methylenetetrahydrofolate reductase [Spirochaetia bacterium]
MEVSLEMVPRNLLSLQTDAGICKSYPGITCVNIPDLLRFPIRSWEACGILKTQPPLDKTLIPHLRARDFSLDEAFPLTDFFREQSITKALVIAGDSPAADSKTYSVNSMEELTDSPTIPFIKKLKAELPELEIYAAFDPYRTNIRYELDYLTAKEAAGAAGFMSQPFFDLRLLEIYAEYLEGKRVFWGIAPVLTAGNRQYWESRNRAIFPRSFRLDLDWNISFARQVLQFCESNSFNLYLMPIKMDLSAYISGIWPG